ncbi:hypothetical protein PENTCL1PPCAC_25025, partial [Pristionchus entomophagus]
REHCVFSPCGHLPMVPESMEAFRKQSFSHKPSPSASLDNQHKHEKGKPLDAQKSHARRSSLSPPESTVSPDASMKRLSPEKCDVCGALASGYNYEGISCGGCKSFFRRAVLGKRKMSCKKRGECGNKTLFKCRACRFNACLEAGMNPLAITTDANSGKFVQQPSHGDQQPSTSRNALKIITAPRTIENQIDRLIEELSHLEVAYDRIRRSNYRPMEGVAVDDCIRGYSRLGEDFGLAPPRAPPHDKPRWKFIPIKVRIRDRIPMQPPPLLCEMSKCNHPPPMMWPHLDLVHAIEYLKAFDFFNCLSEDDKRALARQTTLVTVFLTNSFNSMERKSDVTVYPDGAIPHSGQILEWSEHDAIHDREVHYETVQRVRQLNLNKREYILVKALVASNPAVSGLSAASQDVLQERRDGYARSLLSYCLARRGLGEGPSAYAAILSHVDWLTRLVKRNKDLHVLICSLGLSYARMSTLVDEVYGA